MAVMGNLNYTYSAGVKPSTVQAFIERAFLKYMMPELVHTRDDQKRTLPMHEGSKSVQFRRLTALPAITEPLVEGVTPDGQMITETAFTAMVKPYGGHIEVTDEFNFYLLGDKQREAAELLADQASLSIDTIARNAKNAGLNVQYAGANSARATIAATDKLTYADIKKAVRTLRRNNAKPFADGFFHAILHPDVYFDLTSDAMWVDVAKYQNEGKIEKYELGTIYKVKCFESTNAMIFKAQSYIWGSTSAIVASANYDATNRVLTTATDLSADDARALTGLMVYCQYTEDAVNYVTPMCIESVDYDANKIKFRWNPASSVTDKWVTTKTFKIVPYGGGAAGAPVYSTLVYAQDAFGSVELAGTGRNVEIIINDSF